ncbi:UDP-glucose 4-epimerase GalE [Paenibacillus sp. GXUN7292]|uniref:UDP-glucose 4-epimerase GalE n=1 Tax=Paenibacillus sp. GXUN7292 TaxID=3422499 RepID=UPI003D7DD140
MAILVTGGAGYIGSHTCVELLNQGFDIVVIDNFSNSKPEALERVKQLSKRRFKSYSMNILDSCGLDRIFQEHEIEAVIHFAGLKSVGESAKMPLQYYHNNLNGTLHLCRMMEKHNVRKLVFSSSATVYGHSEICPIKEHFPLTATNPYGRTKLMTEEVLRDLYQADSRWSIALLRYFNPVGAHKSGRIGEDPNGIPNNLMPYITQVAIGRQEKLTIFGDSYNTKDGTGVRDYIHVVDLARGHIKALEKIRNSTGVDAYNLGTGKGYSVLEMVAAFEQASGRNIPFSIADNRPGDVAVCYASPAKAKEILDWEAQIDIQEMCEDAWRWQLQNPNGYENEDNLVTLHARSANVI